jgi:hypothetical protein
MSARDELERHWPTLLGATLGTAFGSAALPFYTAGLFMVQFQHEFGWTRTELTAIGLAVTLLIAVIAPFAGAVYDRVGVRWPALIGFLTLAAQFLYLSRSSGSLFGYAAIQIPLVMLVIGTSPIALTRPINLAFDRMRGLALGITIGGIGAMAAIAPPIVARLIENHGWRHAYEALAASVLVVGPIAVLLVSWRRPTVRESHTPMNAIPLAQHARTWLFWRLILCFVLIALAVGGFVTHFVPLLTDAGMSTIDAAKVAGLLGVSVLVGRLGAGALIDLFFAPYIAAALMAVTAVGLGLLAIGGTTFAVPGALAVGLAMGAEVDLIAYLTARYYGMIQYSRMYGLLYGSFVIGTGASPYLISLIQAAAHSYTQALWMSIGLLILVTLLFLSAPRFEAYSASSPSNSGRP